MTVNNASLQSPMQKKATRGRPKSADPRIQLPFRLKTSVVDKAKRVGRDRVETSIERIKE